MALRNINLIVQKRPTILAHEIKVFFCKYNDPIYVKMEKLEIMIKLASERNVDQARMHRHMHTHTLLTLLTRFSLFSHVTHVHTPGYYCVPGAQP